MLHGVSRCLVCSGVHARYTDAFILCVPTNYLSDTNNVGDSVQRQAECLVKCEAFGDTGCESVTVQSCGNGCYGHTRVDVCMEVDLLLYRSLFVALDPARPGEVLCFIFNYGDQDLKGTKPSG